MTRPCLAALLALILSSCGFHLRDALTLPPDLGPVRVIAPDPYSPLAESLAQGLQRAGAVAAAEGAVDVATLEIVSERWADTPISVDEVGRAQEFTLRYAVVFALHRAAGAGDVVPPQTIELARDYIAPPADAIGTASERELLAREVRRDMASTILRRIDAVSRAPAPAPSTISDSTTPGEITEPTPPAP